MKRNLLLASTLSAIALFSLHAEPTPTKVLGETDTVWPGIKLQVTKLARIDATHVAAAIRISVSPSAPPTTLIGELPPNVSMEDIQSGKASPQPYSLTSASLLDESTKQEFKALPTPPVKPSFGPNSLLTTQTPNTWIQLGVVFPCPPPLPAGPDGKIPPQRVTFRLPKGNHPIEHVVLPEPTPAVSD